MTIEDATMRKAMREAGASSEQDDDIMTGKGEAAGGGATPATSPVPLSPSGSGGAPVEDYEVMQGGDDGASPQDQGDTSVLGAYGYDPDAAGRGRWTPWPALGPRAKLRIASSDASAWRTTLEKLMRKYGRSMSQAVRRKTYPAHMSRTLLLGIAGIRLKPLGSPEPDIVIHPEHDQHGRVTRRLRFKFRLDERGELVDCQSNRQQLLALTWPRLADEILMYADDTSNFKEVQSEAEILGN